MGFISNSTQVNDIKLLTVSTSALQLINCTYK